MLHDPLANWPSSTDAELPLGPSGYSGLLSLLAGFLRFGFDLLSASVVATHMGQHPVWSLLCALGRGSD